MASPEFYDDGGSDIEQYEDALEELALETEQLDINIHSKTEPLNNEKTLSEIVGSKSNSASPDEGNELGTLSMNPMSSKQGNETNEYGEFEDTHETVNATEPLNQLDKCEDGEKKVDNVEDVQDGVSHSNNSYCTEEKPCLLDKDISFETNAANVEEDSSDSSNDDDSSDKEECEVDASGDAIGNMKLHEKLNAESKPADNDASDEENDASEEENSRYFIDEEAMKSAELDFSEDEVQSKKDDGQALKALGNDLFKEGKFTDAVDTYTDALRVCPLCCVKERSIMYSNRGASFFKMNMYELCIKDCTKALELNPAYLKALLRRAESYEKSDKLEEALQDYQKVLEMDPSIHHARAACVRLRDQINERNEKLKAEMMGKLKDLGNLVLRPFGLSTNNFQMVQDPNSGGYSVNFVNNPPSNGY